VVLLPALNPDVALIHAQQAGEDGTVRIRGLSFADLEEAKASDRVIVACEEVVPAASLRSEPERNLLPPFLRDAVVPVPFGAHPTACAYHYDYDAAHLNLYKGLPRTTTGSAATWTSGSMGWPTTTPIWRRWAGRGSPPSAPTR
jgi:glutaconate CoA-transferase subunit A